MATQHFSLQRGPTASHGLAQTVRAHLGLTQQDLAVLLGVSRATLAMAELGRRSLPPAANLLLAQLGEAVTTVPEAATATPTPLSPAQRDTLTVRRQGIGLEEHSLHQQLKRAQTRLLQARQRQQAESVLRAALPATNAAAHRKLSHLAEESEQYLRDEGATPALLELRLRVLAFERAEIDKLLGGGPA
jgi:transcriptional regulator with XRE-family HTH domain